MEECPLPLEVLLAIIWYSDGVELVYWSRTCKRLHECISANDAWKFRMRNRVAWCNTVQDAWHVLGVPNLNGCKRIGTDETVTLVGRKVALPSHESLYVGPDGQTNFRCGDYIYFKSDEYDGCDLAECNAMGLEQAFPDVFRLYNITFARCAGYCLANEPGHVCAGGGGDCCHMGVHRGHVIVLRAYIGPKKRKAMSNNEHVKPESSKTQFPDSTWIHARSSFPFSPISLVIHGANVVHQVSPHVSARDVCRLIGRDGTVELTEREPGGNRYVNPARMVKLSELGETSVGEIQRYYRYALDILKC